MVADVSNYAGREQAYVKHYFLESYLERLVHKTAGKFDEIAYVDGFSGPWQSKGEAYSDTSFGIALTALRKAKASWKALGREVRMSAHLVERAPDAYRELEAIKAKFPDIDVRTYKDDFVAVSSTILAAIPAAAFAFVLIDPKAWRIDTQQLAPLLSRPNSEVVFNFMFDFINRAASIADPAIVDGLAALMPHGNWREELAALTVEAPADAPRRRKAILAEGFAETLRKIGGFDFVAAIPVLRPLKDRTLYSLFYATRHATGIEVFRDCHVKTERKQASLRSATKRAHRAATSGQTEMFGAEVQMGPDEIDAYLDAERVAARASLIAMTPLLPAQTTYKALWPGVLAKHAVTRPDVNRIAAELRKDGTLVFHDWDPKKRVPADRYRLSRSN